MAPFDARRDLVRVRFSAPPTGQNEEPATGARDPEAFAQLPELFLTTFSSTKIRPPKQWLAKRLKRVSAGMRSGKSWQAELLVCRPSTSSGRGTKTTLMPSLSRHEGPGMRVAAPGSRPPPRPSPSPRAPRRALSPGPPPCYKRASPTARQPSQDRPVRC